MNPMTILFDDTFCIESRGGEIFLHYLNAEGVLEIINIGGPFSNLARSSSFPWIYTEGENRGFIINFSNVILYEGFERDKNGDFQIPLKAAKGEILEGRYGFIDLKDFPFFESRPASEQTKKLPLRSEIPGLFESEDVSAFTSINPSATKCTALTFRQAPLKGYAVEHKLMLLLPIDVEIIRALEKKQRASPPVPGIRLNYIPRPSGSGEPRL